jgi:GT2 family glycosyltransferase
MGGDVTVLLPCGNTTQHLRTALASCLSQSEPPRSILVIDDASSKEASSDIQKTSGMNSVITIVRNKGTGIVDALNTGLNQVDSEFVARMDADDFSLRDRFALQRSTLVNDQSLVAVGGLVRYMNEDGSLMEKIPWVRNGFPLEPLHVVRMLAQENVLFHPSLMMRTSALKGVGGYTKNHPHIEDYDLWLRLLKLGDLRNVNHTVLYYRRHEAQVSEIHALDQLAGVLALHKTILNSPHTKNLPYIYSSIRVTMYGEDVDALIDAVRELARATEHMVDLTCILPDEANENDRRSIYLAASLRGSVHVMFVASKEVSLQKKPKSFDELGFGSKGNYTVMYSVGPKDLVKAKLFADMITSWSVGGPLPVLESRAKRSNLWERMKGIPWIQRRQSSKWHLALIGEEWTRNSANP